jgi:serine/threonine protein kinase
MVGSPHPEPTESRPSDPLRRAHGSHPERIGPYRILEELGEGGMGVVYLAEQTAPIHRRVALKVIKLGMDTRQVIARFEAEREALALMNHPNVAQVFEAGSTDDGRPYFAMEHVPGIPITEYCDLHRLSTAERLGLFIDACHAVQHAHQKGIIHRDIKPSNVLVMVQGDLPAVKVIDFGVAKATHQRLTERTLFTEHGQLVGTPGYMSPEQASLGTLDIDTRTDIYALGVLLYELLVGSRPFDDRDLRKAGIDEIQRIIREVDPPKPSTRFSSLGDSSTVVAQNRRTEPRRLARELRGELDWIVMKCLEKERAHRYATADELGLEIRRHLNHEVVRAGPPKLTYRARKFVRRNRTPLAAASILLIAVMFSGYFYVRARGAYLALEAATAGAQAMRYAEEAQSFLLQGKVAAAWAPCRTALAIDPGNSVALRTHGFLLLQDRGDFSGALDAYDRGLAPLAELRMLPQDFHNRARLRRMLGRYQEALDDHNRAVILRPHEGLPYASRAVTQLFLGNSNAAIEDLAEAYKRDSTWALQGNLWIWETRMLRGGPGDAEAAATALAEAQRAQTGDPFDQLYAEICRGTVTPEAAMARCSTDRQRSFAYYYLGAKALVDGRPGDAADWFRKCVSTNEHRDAEYDLARWHLERLPSE